MQHKAGMPELQGADGDLLQAGIMAPIVIAVLYGVCEFIATGTSRENYLYTYVPVFWGIAAIIGFEIYWHMEVYSSGGRTWGNMLRVFVGTVPYFFFVLYIVLFFGVYRIFQGFVLSFSVWQIIGGIVWMFLGYRSVNQANFMMDIVRGRRRVSNRHPLSGE